MSRGILYATHHKCSSTKLYSDPYHTLPQNYIISDNRVERAMCWKLVLEEYIEKGSR